MSQHYRYCSEKKTFEDKNIKQSTELTSIELDIPKIKNTKKMANK
jgi:hypothetical protein